MKGLQFLCLLLIGSLFALTGLRQFFIAPLEGTATNFIWFLLQVAPLLLVLPGVLALRVRPCFMTILVAMLYFIHGVMLAATDLRALGLWETGFAVALILTATLLVRRLGPPPPEADPPRDQ